MLNKRVDCLRGKRNAVSAFLSALMVGLALSSSAEIFVRPGDTGRILLTVPNSADSFGPMAGVTVSPNSPTSIVIQNSSVLGPVDIQPGSNAVFEVSYVVASDAPEGVATVSLNVSAGMSNVFPRTAVTDFTFSVKILGPRVTFGPALGSAGLKDIQGIFPLVPSSIHDNLEFRVDSDEADVSSVRLHADSGDISPFVTLLSTTPGFFTSPQEVRDLSALNPPIAGVVGRLDPDYHAFLPRGLYTLTAENAVGLKTETSFRMAGLTVDYLKSTSELDPTTGFYAGVLRADISSTLGLLNLQRFNRWDFSSLGVIPLGGASAQASFSVAPDDQPDPQQSDTIAFMVTDVEGNTYRHDFGSMTTSEGPGRLLFSSPSSTASVPVNMSRDPGGNLLPGPGNSSYVSPLFNSFDWGALFGGGGFVGILPGAQMRAGYLENPATHVFATHTVVDAGFIEVDNATGPIVEAMSLGRFKLRLFTADDPAALAGAGPSFGGAQEVVLYDREVSAKAVFGGMPGGQNLRAVLKRFHRFTLEVETYPQAGILSGLCQIKSEDGRDCLAGRRPIPRITAIGSGIFGINFTGFRGPTLHSGGELASGTRNATMPMGNAVTLSEINLLDNGIPVEFFLTFGTFKPEYGRMAVPAGAVFDIRSGFEQSQDGPVMVTIKYGSADLTPAQVRELQIVRLDSNMRQIETVFDGVVIDTTAMTASFRTPRLGAFALLAPIFPNTQAVRVPGMEFLSNQEGVTLAVVEPEEAQTSRTRKILRAKGKVPATRLYRAGPSPKDFNPPGAVRVDEDDAEAGRQGVPPGTGSLEQFTEKGSFVPMGAETANSILRYRVRSNHIFRSLFAILASTAPVPFDETPPATALSFQGGVSIGAGGAFLIASTTAIRLDAVDFGEEDLPPSGLAGIFYLVDQVFVSTTQTPGRQYDNPFTLSTGAHTLVYFSTDQLGNFESPKTAQIEVFASSSPGGGAGGPPGGGGGGGDVAAGSGLGLSADPEGGIWMVVRDTHSNISLSKFSSTGVIEGAVPLPGAGDFGAWRIGFDEQGNAVAVGSSMGETTGPDVAVYRVSPEGALLSTAAFDAGLGGADIAMDASGDLWIAGAVQTGGQSEADLQAQMALWRYTTQEGLKLKSLYAGPGGLDAGFGVRLDGSGNVWIVGFSSNPATPGANKLDLALWKYNATGSSLTAGPFRKPGYARGIGETTNAKLAIETGAVYLAAGKLNGAGNMNLATAKHDLSGSEIWSRTWSSNPVADDVPSAILSSPQGLSIAGGVFRGQDRPLAVWRYSLDGTLFSAETSSGVGKANDITSNPEGTWLAVEGRGVPFKFTGGTALPGSGDGQVPPDTLPPRTTLSVGEPKSGTDPIVITTFTTLGFTAVDDLAQVGDGAGSGVRETLYLVDIDPQSCDGVVQVSTAPKGTCANPVYSSTFTLAAGTHTIAYLSRDNAGNEEAPQQANFTVNLVFSAPTDNKPPRTTLAIGAPQFGAVPLFIATHTPLSLSAVDDLTQVGDGLGSGVGQTLFLIDVTPQSCEGVPQSTAAPRGTCANSVYASTFTLGVGTHTITFLSRDFIGNEEVAQVRSLTVDGAPPVTAALVNGQAASSEILTSTDSISFSATDAGSGVRDTFYRLDGAPAASSTQAFSLAAGTHSLVFFSVDNLGNRETDKSANLTVVGIDTTVPALTLAPPAGSTVTTARPLIRADYSDAGRGIDAASVRLELDGVDITTLAVVTASSAAYATTTDLGQGTHTIAARVLDLAGNQTSASSRFFVDSIAPATSLLINGQAAPSGTLVLISTDSISFMAADAGAGVRETRYSLDGAAEEVFMGAFTLAAGTHTLGYRSQDNAGNLETAKTAVFSVVGPDLTAPVTVLEIGQPKFVAGLVYIATATKLGLTASEPGRIYFSVDGGTFAVYAGSFTISGEGLRTVSWYGEDSAGNRELTKSATVFVDATAPISEILLNGASVAGGSLNAALGDVFGFSSTDTASGVRGVRYSLDSGSFQVFAGTFTLGVGAHTLRFRGQDNVLNLEQERSVAILVASPGGDQTPPALSLLCPGVEGGICSVFRETISVRGSVFDLALARYRLEAGGVLISSGTGNMEGVLGVWDVSGLAGAQELTLTGEDLAGNTATLTRQVFVGEPARLLVFGGKKEMGQPQGVAVDDARGIVYVANTNKGEIRLYTLGGEFIKAYPDYRHPRAVAVDEVGNLYIAESGKDRIVKLGPLGNLLWMKGKTGRGALEFWDPSGIAAKGGKVVISDTRNRRVQVLDDNGNFLQEFPIPEGSETLVSDDGDSDDEPENRKGVPVGIALDGQGRIYVADAKNKKGLAYDAQGVLLREFGGPAVFRRPEGIAVSTSGECVFVSDRIKDRVVKFDGEGRSVLAFGTQGNISGKRTIPVETVFRRPIGLYLDLAGTLWTADRNNEVIQRFGLPGALTAGSLSGGAFRVTDEEESRGQGGQASSGTEEFYLREAYAIPNPCKGCGSQGFVVQVGLADSVNLECRNVMGRVVYQNAFPSPTLKDIGNGRGPQYTFEQHWPLSGVGTGVYACTVTARKAGKSEIRKVLRSAVIR